jgi:hypothetical protein
MPPHACCCSGGGASLFCVTILPIPCCARTNCAQFARQCTTCCMLVCMFLCRKQGLYSLKCSHTHCWSSSGMFETPKLSVTMQASGTLFMSCGVRSSLVCLPPPHPTPVPHHSLPNMECNTLSTDSLIYPHTCTHPLFLPCVVVEPFLMTNGTTPHASRSIGCFMV